MQCDEPNPFLSAPTAAYLEVKAIDLIAYKQVAVKAKDCRAILMQIPFRKKKPT